MDNNLQKLQETFGEARVRVNELMRLHTTYKIGGPAQYYLDVATIADLQKAVLLAQSLQIPVTLIGGGSNIVVADKGIKGLVIKNNCRKFEVVSMVGKMKNQSAGWQIDVDNSLIYAESGVIMNQLVRYTIEEGLAGLEYQLGLPGTVGGAAYMNSNWPKIGAYVGDHIYRAKLLTKEGEVKEVDNSYFQFAYDHSVLQETGEIVLSVVFQLVPEDKKILWERATQALQYRQESQPKGVSAGCTFRNISLATAERIPTPKTVTSAGYYIDKAGLKGKRIGDAMISEVHANFILNMGAATASDVMQLITLVKEEVLKKFHVGLHLEIKPVGF